MKLRPQPFATILQGAKLFSAFSHVEVAEG